MNKKGISEIIAMSILILSILAGATIVFNSIQNTFSLSPEFTCLEMTTSPQIKIHSACFNSQTNSINFELSGSLSNTLSELTILADLEEYTEWSCGNSCGTCTLPGPGQTQQYSIQTGNPEAPESLSLKFEDCIFTTQSLNSC